MLHRAVLGSLERFLGILLENFAGAMPVWLHFEQAAVVPIGKDFNEYAQKINNALLAAGIRSNAYLDDDNMKNKIRLISMQNRTPYILVVGEKEKAENSVTVRFRHSSGLPQRTFSLDEFIASARNKIDTHSLNS